ncbi:MAG TPA: hypothetical protein VHY22_11620, partial [Chthoniobacteraceae bacterium]|nr:hypothetical protein [Chthoniobacteraceae bacterium]
MIARFPSQKKRRPNRPVTRWPGLCLLLAALATARVAHAQEYNETILEPQALRLQVTGAYGGVLAEGDYSTDSVIGQNGATGTYEQIFLGPVFGLDAAGSIYHPNLLSFTLDGEISPGYAIEKTRSSTYNSDSGTGFTILGNYDARFTFLGEKPYRATLYITQSYTDQDLDEFTQTQVDTFTYGGTLGYQSGPVPFTLGAAEQWQNTYGGPYQITSRQESLSFDARNTRVSGESTLDYLYNEY